MANPMQARFHELTAEKAKIEAAAADIQKRYDDLAAQINELDKQIRPVAAELRAARAPIYDIDNERAALARALNGQTGKA